jgi:hypothetical protein
MSATAELVTPSLVRASSLPKVWALRYPALKGPATVAAVSHVADAVGAMAAPYRLGFSALLRLLPVAFLLVTGRPAHSAPPDVLLRGFTRLARLPGVTRALRMLDALALYGGLDGLAGPSGAVVTRTNLP